jgi:hypothetical protein
MLRTLKKRHEKLLKDGRCVDCEEALRKPKSKRFTVQVIVRCAECIKKIERRPLSFIHPRTFFFSYLEHSWVGSNVGALLLAVKELTDIDQVAFRVVHQIANVMQGVRHDDSLDRLKSHKSFESWQDDAPSSDIRQIEAREYGGWGNIEVQSHSNDTPEGYTIMLLNSENDKEIEAWADELSKFEGNMAAGSDKKEEDAKKLTELKDKWVNRLKNRSGEHNLDFVWGEGVALYAHLHSYLVTISCHY